MAEDKFSDQQIPAFHRLLEHLPKGNDLELLALKDHLLVEEQLFERLERNVPNPQFVRKANLRTGQLIALIEVMRWQADRAWVWHMAWALNKLRNELSIGWSLGTYTD